MKIEAQETWDNFGRENLNEIQKSSSITSNYFAKDDLFVSRCHTIFDCHQSQTKIMLKLYCSIFRASFKSKQAKTLLNKKLFGRIWEQNPCITARIGLYLAAKADYDVKKLEADQDEKSHEPEPRSHAPGSNNIVKLDSVTVRLVQCTFLGPKLSGYHPVSVPNLDVRDDGKILISLRA